MNDTALEGFEIVPYPGLDNVIAQAPDVVLSTAMDFIETERVRD